MKKARSSLGHPINCMRLLNGVPDDDIARRRVKIIDYMRKKHKMDAALFIYYLSWSLKIPADMVREQSIIRWVSKASSNYMR